MDDDDFEGDHDFNQNQHQPLHPTNYPDYPNYPPHEQPNNMMNMPPPSRHTTPPPPTPLRLPTPQKRSRTPTPPPPQPQPPPPNNYSPPPPPTPRKPPGPPPQAPPPVAVSSPPPPAPRKTRPPPQYQDYYDEDDEENASRRRFCAVLFILLVLVGLAALILWLVYRPHKPKYTAVAAAVYSLNVTTPTPLVSASVQITVLTRNSNKRTALSYDGLTATIYYRNAAITRPVNLPPLVQRKRSTVMMSPVVGGVPVAVPGDVANGLVGDEAYGVVGLSWVLTGRVKYRAGLLRSGHSRVSVKCDVLVRLSGATNGVFVNPPGQVPLLGTTPCLVDM